MAIRKTTRRLTKKAFLAQMTSGALSTDRVLADLVAELQCHEQKYGMHSEIFYTLIAGTPAEDHPDFLQWAMCYRGYFRAVQAKFPRRDLAPAAQHDIFARLQLNPEREKRYEQRRSSMIGAFAGDCFVVDALGNGSYSRTFWHWCFFGRLGEPSLPFGRMTPLFCLPFLYVAEAPPPLSSA